MISSLSAVSESVTVLNNQCPSNESYALNSTAISEDVVFQQCLATDKPPFEELDHSLPEPQAQSINIVCLMLLMIIVLMLINSALILISLVIHLVITVKNPFSQRQRNAVNHENENESNSRPVPSREDSRRGKGDQEQNRGHRRQRRSFRSTLTSPSAGTSTPSLPPVANSLPVASVVPVAALIACTQDTSPDATQMSTSAARGSPRGSSMESSADRLIGIVGSDLLETEESDPGKVWSVGSQPKKLQHARKAGKQMDSDRPERKRQEDDNIAEFSSMPDPASAQHHADSDDSTRTLPENHRTSKSAKKRTEIPVLVDMPCAARCGLKMEPQSSSNQRGSPCTKVPVLVMPDKLCDLGGNSCLISEDKDNEWMSSGVEYQLGDSQLEEVRRSGNCNEATNVEEAPIPMKKGSNPFERNWEQRTPVWQDKRGYSMSMSGMSCEALLAIDALLEEEDDTMEMAPDGKKPAIKPRDLQLPTNVQVMGRSM